MLKEIGELHRAYSRTGKSLKERGIKKGISRLKIMTHVASAALEFTSMVLDSGEMPNANDAEAQSMGLEKLAYLRSHGAQLITKVGLFARGEHIKLYSEEHDFIDRHATRAAFPLQPFTHSADSQSDFPTRPTPVKST